MKRLVKYRFTDDIPNNISFVTFDIVQSSRETAPVFSEFIYFDSTEYKRYESIFALGKDTLGKSIVFTLTKIISNTDDSILLRMSNYI